MDPEVASRRRGFLYDLMDEAYQEEKRKYPRNTRLEIVTGLELTAQMKADWERRFNARFAGTTPPGETKPRRPRNAGAIVQQCERSLRLGIHFRRPMSTTSTTQKKDKEPGMKDKIKLWYKERDEMEEADARAIEEEDRRNPPADPNQGRMTRTVRRSRSGRTAVKHLLSSSSEENEGDGGSEGDDGDGGDGDGEDGSGGAGTEDGARGSRTGR